MKTLGVGIVLMVALFFCLPYHLYMKQLWKKNPEKSWEKARRFVSGFFRFELKLSGCKVNVIGKENIPQDGPVLFVGNHRSYFDILIYHEAIGKPLGFLAKKEMEKIPLLPLYMRDIGCLFLDREDIKQGLSVIKQGTEYMKQDIRWSYSQREPETRPTHFCHFARADIRWQRNRNPRSFRYRSAVPI